MLTIGRKKLICFELKNQQSLSSSTQRNNNSIDSITKKTCA
ncbi:hypothetical protein M119_0688 [Bacteroides fragilis str. 3783N1-6]|uniref:Uncharacterized protein n=1 Tax=Bacteroides fragilis str. 3783N1-6 TaxID=1339310 RepID=A0AB73ARQ8_BACFG|nr:hypothetical protein M118_0614 [Bacteroides fragilis str. 3783N1-2]EXY52564.1 hypothetical protein M121_0605 [Bacteroides fragilis str. 3783N2-1]EXY57300.1 hypothetical protein M122_0607 [Bacteroides fragilis str. 3976T7]EXZ69422.1 hypothetical protein M120_0895 [Bacteroides fragilis str. 3783N1-8]EYB11154.1 hypothetical protein M119_0688 [Bacteroides fragilis str. 3783N1-6]